MNDKHWLEMMKQVKKHGFIDHAYDFYFCCDCNNFFAVQENAEPKACPYCKGKSWEYSHTLASWRQYFRQLFGQNSRFVDTEH